MSYLSRLREAENFPKRPSPPSVESVYIPDGGIKDTLNTARHGPFSKNRAWIIQHQDGRITSNTFTPPATLAEVMRLHPHALAIEPDEDLPAREKIGRRQTYLHPSYCAEPSGAIGEEG